MDLPRSYACWSSGLPWMSPTSILPPPKHGQGFSMQVFHQVVIIEDGILKAMAFSRHQKSGRFPVSAKQVAASLFQSKQTIQGGAQLPAHGPVIQRTGKNDHIAVPNCRIDLVHIVPAGHRGNPGHCARQSTLCIREYSFYPNKIPLRYGLHFPPLSEHVYQGRGVAVFTGASI